jgi:heat shock protein HslJ
MGVARKLISPRIVAVVMSIMMVVGCQPSNTDDERPTIVALTGALTTEELRNAGYYLGLDEDPIALTEGEWYGEPFSAGGASRPGAGFVDDFNLTGDLNGDGVDETVVLLWTNSGGSGTFDFIAVMGRDDAGTPINLATAALGDRVRIRAAAIDDGIIVVDVVQAGSDDPACCPGQKVRRSFALEDGALNELASKNLGRQSIADLGGIDWVLQRFDRDEPVPEEIEITIVFDGDRIGGGSGCNRYSGSVTEGTPPGTLTVKMPMASTMMACPPPADELERRYLTLLQGVRQYSFSAGKLTLSWQIEGQDPPPIGTMIFHGGRNQKFNAL